MVLSTLRLGFWTGTDGCQLKADMDVVVAEGEEEATLQFDPIRLSVLLEEHTRMADKAVSNDFILFFFIFLFEICFIFI